MILMYIHSQLKGKENACARCVLKSCICCLWCLEKCLNYLNQNAYTATAINSTNFCTSAKDAFVILVENALRVAAINTVGDFMLFLGKVLIVCSTGLAGDYAAQPPARLHSLGAASDHRLPLCFPSRSLLPVHL
uniref:Choline transporter-like protein n=1 Tax=Ixodes ricinus TaxID=34613 RepID=A0A0K8RME4_IXORI